MIRYEESYQTKKHSGMHVQAAMLGALVAASIFIAGGFLIHNRYGPPPPAGPGFGGACCDTGDGDACVPQKGPGQTLTFTSPTSLTFKQFKGAPVQYDLLKSNAQIFQCFKHGKDSGQTVNYPATSKYPGVHPIIYNNSQELGGSQGECPPGFDQIADFRGGKHCAPIPDDELIYVCVANCEPPFGKVPSGNTCEGSPVYGNSSTVYDIYIRDADYPNPGVPEVIKNCRTTSPQNQSICPTNNPNPQYVMGTPAFWPEHKTLQLHTFYPGINYVQCQVLMPRPFCKPAVYVYPPQKEEVHIQLAPKGKITYTDPAYPVNGWSIIASPNGSLEYQKKQYDYLYYEAAIPDNLFQYPMSNDGKGYVISYNDLSTFFDATLPKLGLNEKEKHDFKKYWLKALPNSPYYFISLIPQTIINNISPLTISPSPDTIIRLTLNFQPLDKKISAAPPVLPGIKRTGFTIVEWGGTFKQDKNHPFTCLL